MDNQSPSTKRSFNSSWLLWWQIDPEELNRQVTHYHTLSIFKSARGNSLLFLLLSAVITTLFIMFLGHDFFAFVDVALFIILGLFIYRGHRWAMIAAMVLWTIEKVYSLADGQALSNIFTIIIWWTAYMHAFYLAWRTEKARLSQSSPSQITPPSSPTPLQTV